jgi:hypothetical protein
MQRPIDRLNVNWRDRRPREPPQIYVRGIEIDGKAEGRDQGHRSIETYRMSVTNGIHQGSSWMWGLSRLDANAAVLSLR